MRHGQRNLRGGLALLGTVSPQFSVWPLLVWLDLLRVAIRGVSRVLSVRWHKTKNKSRGTQEIGILDTILSCVIGLLNKKWFKYKFFLKIVLQSGGKKN